MVEKKYHMTKAERRAQEKIRRAQETSVSCAGKSLIEKLNDELDKAMKDYLKLKKRLEKADDQEWLDNKDKLKQKRGLVRGIAIGVGMIENAYELEKSTKLAEKESAERCRIK